MLTTTSPVVWLAFNGLVVALLVLDALVLSPPNKEIKIRKAVLLSAFWVTLAFIFNIGIYVWLGQERALEFLTAYLIEQSLSIDNLFVFLLIFSYFKVPPLEQRRILFWGIIGAQVMRALFILAGIVLLKHFHWLMYVFGAFLVYTGFKLFFEHKKEVDPEHNPVLIFVRRFFPGMGPFMVVLVVIETTDLIFAIDSIPAVLAITKDPFIAYTSNIFAILGLRAMYFVLAGFMQLFHHLHYALGAILIFIGFKMLIEHVWAMPSVLALGFIAVAVATSILTSILFPAKDKKLNA